MTWNSPHFRACAHLLVCFPLTATMACDEESSRLDGDLELEEVFVEGEYAAPTSMPKDIPHGPESLEPPSYERVLMPDQVQLSLLGNDPKPITLEACVISGTTITCNGSEGTDDVPFQFELIVLEEDQNGCMVGIVVVGEEEEGLHELEICNHGVVPRTGGDTRGQGPVIDDYEASTEAEDERRKQLLNDEASGGISSD